MSACGGGGEDAPPDAGRRRDSAPALPATRVAKVVLDEELQRRIEMIKYDTTLETRPIPKRPVLPPAMPTRAKLVAITKYIVQFEYNHTGAAYFCMKRDRGLKHVTTTAKEIIREALPIQCVEAVFLACFLTSEMRDLDRYPLSFKSQAGESSHRHIVLAVHDKNKNLWGALGISRKNSLMHKDLKYASLSDLVANYKQSYEDCRHDLTKVYVGLPLDHNPHSIEAVRWRVLKLNLCGSAWACIADALDGYVRDLARAVKSQGEGCLAKFKPAKAEDKDDAASSDDEPPAATPEALLPKRPDDTPPRRPVIGV